MWIFILSFLIGKYCMITRCVAPRCVKGRRIVESKEKPKTQKRGNYV